MKKNKMKERNKTRGKLIVDVSWNFFDVLSMVSENLNPRLTVFIIHAFLVTVQESEINE
jgi:hypothetical protein